MPCRCNELHNLQKHKEPTTVFAKYGLPRRRDQRAAVVVSDAIKALPNLQGWGELGSLHQAMARDAS